MRASRTTTVLAACLALGLGAAACGGDDDSNSGSGDGAPPDSGGLSVTSTAFADGEPIPVEYTCDGDETSPPLAFAGVPAGTAELAVVVRDPDADGFVHWVIAGIPADAGGLDEGAPPAGAVEADNGFDEPGWAGPCPPEGNHTYEFTVYALGEPSGLEAGADAEDGAATVEGADATAVATLRGTFERG
ncbi:MAG: YbhB/YbcL family Raf kinase inhibitor-like protein [Acidimicrobiales bacterium]|nr:YbhB/YbcL family Raf kinase inhibitor-like protein [Acidimicrobiales bacterium]